MLTHELTLVPRAGAFETMSTLNSVNCEKMIKFCLRDTYTVNKWPSSHYNWPAMGTRNV